MKPYIKPSFVLLITTTIALFAFNACTNSSGNVQSVSRKGDPIPVRVATIEPVTKSGVVHTSGRVITEHEAILGFKVGGVITSINVSEGDRIRKGQVLASIDLREIDAIVSQAQLGFEKSERDFQRVKNLFRDSVVTLETYQNAETAMEVARQQLQSAKVNKQYSTIRAPYEGFVLGKFVNTGQVIGLGDPVLKINKIGKNEWILRVNVSDREWSAIQLGDRAEVQLDALPKRTIHATVLRKSESSDAVTGTFSVDLVLQNSPSVASGMFGTARISTKQVSNVWSVPFEAVLDADGDKGFVFVTSDFKTAIKLPVTISSFDEASVSIAEELSHFKALIISGSAYLTDKSEITVIK